MEPNRCARPSLPRSHRAAFVGADVLVDYEGSLVPPVVELRVATSFARREIADDLPRQLMQSAEFVIPT